MPPNHISFVAFDVFPRGVVAFGCLLLGLVGFTDLDISFHIISGILQLTLQSGYTVKGKPGSMVTMAGTVQIKVRTTRI
jgi:hypothetical protein